MPINHIGLTKALEENDVYRVKAIIKTALRNDRCQRHYKTLELANYVERVWSPKSQALFDDDNGLSSYHDQKDLWNSDYWNVLLAEFYTNLSRQKLMNLIEVMSYLRQQGHAKFQIDTAQEMSVISQPKKIVAPWLTSMIAAIMGALLTYGLVYYLKSSAEHVNPDTVASIYTMESFMIAGFVAVLCGLIVYCITYLKGKK